MAAEPSMEPPSGTENQQASFYGATGADDGPALQAEAAIGGAESLLKDKLAQLRAGIKLADMPALVVPWFLFVTVIIPTSITEELFLGQLALLLGAIASAGFMLLSRWRAWRLLAFTCAASVALGWGMGRYDRNKYLYQYLVYQRSPSHEDVLPSSSPGGYRDAGYLTFSDDTHVDGTMGLGYRSGDLWCVAPLTQGGYVQAPAVAGYWAVGKNCCKERGRFNCADIHQSQMKDQGGLVVMDLISWVDPDALMYQKAAQAAAETYGLTLPDKPIFVRWGTEPNEVLGQMFGDARDFALISAALFGLLVPIFVVLFGCLGLQLTSRTGGRGWNPDKVEEMTFGVSLDRKKTYSDMVRLDMLNDRCYWSGEVIYDYAFHVANNHMFLGCLFAHPVHPYSKVERIAVVSIVLPLIIFPVAALSALCGESGMLRGIVVLVAVTVPRQLLKRWLVDVSQQDEREELEGGRKNLSRSSKNLQKQMVIVGVCFVAAVVISVLCVKYVHDHVDNTISFILGNCDGIGFAFILEPLLQMFVPYIGQGKMCIGFFGRWREERDDFEEDSWRFENVTDKVGLSDM